MDMAAAFKDLLMGVLIVLSFALTVIGYLSWSRTRSPRIAMVTLAFVVFLVKGIILAVSLYLMGWTNVPRDFAASFDLMLLSDVLVLLLLYMALFRRKGSGA